VVKERNPDILQTHHVKSHCIMRLTGIVARASLGGVASRLHHHRLENARLQSTRPLVAARAQLVMTVNKPFVDDLARIGVPRERLRVLHNQARIGWNAHVTPENVRDLHSRLGIGDEERVDSRGGPLIA
jgi:hypothetical protein